MSLIRFTSVQLIDGQAQVTFSCPPSIVPAAKELFSAAFDMASRVASKTRYQQPNPVPPYPDYLFPLIYQVYCVYVKTMSPRESVKLIKENFPQFNCGSIEEILRLVKKQQKRAA